MTAEEEAVFVKLSVLLKPDDPEAISSEPKDKDDSWWETDAQYHSMYLDRKDEIQKENSDFLASHPEVRQMCNDFLMHLLQRKPDDVYAEAQTFFGNLENA
eukprot:m.339026 g.339026  ORF g.339026 m.339026 type:complete len:101 (+) comp18636_c0_seq1:174-476(+)